jgi:hypothetical protein
MTSPNAPSEQHTYSNTRPLSDPRPSTPPPVAGRAHTSIQTETYLHDLRVKAQKVDSETQTLVELDVPAPRLFDPFTPLFFPRNCHKDQAVNTDADQLFDFDLHVEPVLDVLVDRALSEALFEVLEEQELADVRARDKGFSNRLQGQAAAVGKLEQRERRISTERAEAAVQRASAVAEHNALRDAAAARESLRAQYEGVAPDPVGNLVGTPALHAALVDEVTSDFVPALTARVVAGSEAGHAVSLAVEKLAAVGVAGVAHQRTQEMAELRARVQAESLEAAEAVVTALEQQEEARRRRLAAADEEEDEEEAGEVGARFAEDEDDEEVVLFDDDDEETREEKLEILRARQERVAAVQAAAAEKQRALAIAEAIKADEAAAAKRRHDERVKAQAAVLSRGHPALEAEDRAAEVQRLTRPDREYSAREYGEEARALRPHMAGQGLLEQLEYVQPSISVLTHTTANPANAKTPGPVSSYGSLTSTYGDWASSHVKNARVQAVAGQLLPSSVTNGAE